MPRHIGVSATRGLEFYPFLFYLFSVNEKLKNRMTDQALLRIIAKEFDGCDSVASSMKLSIEPSKDYGIDKREIVSSLYLTKASIAKFKQWRSMYNNGTLVGMKPEVFSFEYTDKGIRKIAGSVNLSADRLYLKVQPLVPDDPRIQTGTFIDYKPQSTVRG